VCDVDVQTLFMITPLNWAEWKAVVAISFPVILIDEAFKLAANVWVSPPTKTIDETKRIKKDQ